MLFRVKFYCSLMLYAMSSFLYCNLAIAIEPKPIDLDGVYFIPVLTISESFDSNIWTASGYEDDPIQASWLTVLEPKFTLAALDRLNSYLLSYQLKKSEYHSSHSDDKTEHVIDSRAHMEFTSRHRLDLNAAYRRKQDERDSTNRLSTNNELGNKYNHTDLNALYGFGSETAKMQLEFGAQQEYLRYINNRYSASQTHTQDHDASTGLVRAYYNYSYKTKLLTEVQHSNYKYSSSNLDNNAWRYLVGAQWQATSKIGTAIKLGIEEKNFLNKNIKDARNDLWEASINWKPRTYSVITLNAKSKTDEGSATEAYINTDQYSLSWEHDWNSRFSSRIEYELQHKDYGSLDYNLEDRRDKLDRYTISTKYNARIWLDLELGYQYINNSSNLLLDNYDRSQVLFNINASL